MWNFKEHGVRHKAQTLEELRDKTEYAINDINDIPLAIIQKVCRSVGRRCCECTVAEGGHFEHVRAVVSVANHILNTHSYGS